MTVKNVGQRVLAWLRADPLRVLGMLFALVATSTPVKRWAEPKRPPALLTTGSLGLAGLTFANAVRLHGWRRAALFGGTGLSVAFAGEASGVNLARILTHRVHPQVLKVPVSALAGWYTITFSTYYTLDSALLRLGLKDAERRRMLLPLATSLVATNLDMILDVYGLDTGLWVWHGNGAYARSIVGINGRRGIPIGNYIGWLLITGPVVGFCQWLTRKAPSKPTTAAAGRVAALTLLGYYLPSVRWAVVRQKPGYILLAPLVPAAIGLALSRKEK